MGELSLRCRMLSSSSISSSSSIPGPYPLEGTSLLVAYPVVTIKNVSRHCPRPPEGAKAPTLRTTVLGCSPTGSPKVSSPWDCQSPTHFSASLLPHWVEEKASPDRELTSPGPLLSKDWDPQILPALRAPTVPSYSYLFTFLVLSKNIDLKWPSSSLQNSRVIVTWEENLK